MKRYVSLFILGLAALGQGVTQAELAARFSPQTQQSQYVVAHRDAVPCSDGAVWVLWTQNDLGWLRGGRWESREERSRSPDLGLFCRLVSPDGADILPPIRLQPPTVDTLGAWTPLTPSRYCPIVSEQGDLIVFIDNPIPSLATGVDIVVSRGVVGPEHTTTVIKMTRSGQRSSIRLEGGILAGTDGASGRKSAALWSWSDSAGNLRCIFCSQDGRRNYVSLRTRDGDLSLAIPQTSFVVAGDEPDSVAPGSLPHETKFDSVGALLWAKRAWDYSDICLVGRETLLVAFAPPEGERDPGWGSQWPGGRIVTYRLLQEDLSFVDSASVPAGTIAGNDFPGLALPRAILRRSTDGFDFYLSLRGGVSSYRFDLKGRPVRGRRGRGTAVPSASCDKSAGQLLYVSTPHAHGTAMWQVEWFGFSKSGSLCHEATLGSSDWR